MQQTAPPPPSLRERIVASAAARARTLRASPVLSPAALREEWRGRHGGHPVDEEHRPHLLEALGWLERAQDSSPDDGIARGYSLAWNPFFRSAGWEPSYPETTGYIIPTLYSACRVLGRPDLARRAFLAARWEIGVQLPDGAVQGGVIGAKPSPAVFNTGQVMLGWLETLERSGQGIFAQATRRAGRFLVAALDRDGHWRRGNSLYARADATLYNARVAWALAEAGTRLDEPDFTLTATRNLNAVAAAQRPNGWFPNACLYRPDRPLLHTLAYTIRGLLEGGRVLRDPRLVESAARAAEPLARMVDGEGRISGQIRDDWSGAASWSCLTGQVQMANNWMRLHEITGDPRWLEPVGPVIRFVKATQNRVSRDPGVRGGIPGSAPAGGEYGRYEILSWATKYFADALMRHQAVLDGRAASSAVSILA